MVLDKNFINRKERNEAFKGIALSSKETGRSALRFAGTGIRCNAVCPGTIVTPMVAGMNPANLDADMFGQMGKHSDLRVQPCMPDDVANILLFLSSDESRAITGQVLVTDFGSTL